MSHNDTEVMPKIPETGFYYHYKHDSAQGVNHYAYEVLGVNYHTEDDCRPIDQYMVSYRPLYDSFVYRLGKGALNDGRPLPMFMSTIEKEGKTSERFTRITDPDILEELMRIRREMYGV